MPNEKADNLLHKFLESKEPEKSAFWLGELLYVEIMPVIEQILIKSLYKAGLDAESAKSEGEDLSSEIITSFILRLNKIQTTNVIDNDLSVNDLFAIQDIQSYFIKATKLKLKDYWRERNPIWCSLRNRIRYVLDKNKDFQYIQSSQLCFLSNKPSNRSKLIIDHLIKTVENDLLITPQTELSEILKKVLDKAKGSLKLNELVEIVFELQNIESKINEISIDDTIYQSTIDNLVSTYNSEVSQESIIKLKEVWLEIKRLIFNHRFAFILTTRELNGFSEIYSFRELRLTNEKEIAELLTLTKEEFEKVWDKLPLSDKETARLLSTKLNESYSDNYKFTEKQISNFRSKAKEKLERRYKDICC